MWIYGDNLGRHEFYQKPEEVVVTIFAKGVPANSVAVEFGEQIVWFAPLLLASLTMIYGFALF